MSESAVFLDTNVFIQCKLLEELPWNEISPHSSIRLIVANAVFDELDRLKSDGNSRRSKRARTACARFRKILRPLERIVIKQTNPNVTLELAPENWEDTQDFSDIDLSRSDHRLVAEALAFSNANRDTDVMLLSHDLGPIRTATRKGLACLETPELWLLPSENDERDKKIDSLTQENQRLRTQFASIDLWAGDDPKVDQESICLDVPCFTVLTGPQIEELIGESTKRFPNETTKLDPGTQHAYKQRIVGSGEFAEHNRRYSEWLDRLRNFLSNVHFDFNLNHQKKVVGFTLHSNGVRPAENLRIELEAFGDLLIQQASSPESVIEAPNPPKLGANRPPTNQFIRKTAPADGPFICESTDPTPTKLLRYSRMHFFHNRDPERLLFAVRPSSDPSSGGMVRCTIIGENLPERLTKEIKVSFSYHDSDSRAPALECLNRMKCLEW
ncbi:MAG: PIN domain-containing protein [Chthoniobacterales bacterium]